MSQRVLFVHDGPMIYNNESGSFYGVHYNDKIVERYSFFGDKVSFLMRVEKRSGLDSEHYSEITHDNFRFIEVPNFKSLRSYAKKKEAENIIMNAVDSHDMVIIRLPSAAGTIAFKHAMKTGKPVLVEFVACVFDALWNYNWQGKLLAHYKYYRYRQLMKRATHTIYVTNEFLQRRYPTKGKSIGCSDVVLKPISKDILDSRLKKIDEHGESPLVLGTVAALNVTYKGQGDVIKAIGQLKKNGFDFKYRLVGQGDSSRLMKLINKHKVEDSVEIIGPLKHDEVFNFLDKIDLYIQPSKQEGLPRAVIEAMSRACPSIGARTAGIPELIPSELVFKPGAIQEIIDLLQNLSEERLHEYATDCFSEAKKFQEELLDEKRIRFYKEFKNDFNLT